MNMKRRICKIISIFLSMVIILECGIIENVRAEEAKIEESEKIHYAVDVGLDWWSSAVINENNELYLWGQFGDGLEPLFVEDNVRKVSMGGKFGGFITKDDELYMFGSWNGYGQLGNGTTSYGYNEPIKIMDNIKDVALGYHHSAAITKNNELYVWGYNEHGQIGDGTTTNRTTPVEIMDNVAQVSLGGHMSGAVTTNGDLYMWGLNDNGQIGDGSTTNKYQPTKIMSGVKKVICGGTHVGAISTEGDLYVWGYNQLGQVGNDTNINVYTPTKIMSDVKDASFGEFHSSAITTNGDLYMWGFNREGQLGNGTLDGAFHPVKLMENVRKVSMKTEHSAAITIDGDLYMWGGNSYGQLGDGTKVDKLVPTKITMPGDDGEDYVGERTINVVAEENIRYFECGDSIRVLASLYEDGELAEYQGTFEFEISDESVAEFSNIEYTEEGTYITIDALKIGSAILKVTNIQTGESVNATITVGYGPYRTDVNNIPVNMDGDDKYNFYVSGMYVCNFNKTNKKEGFDTISMDVYNSEHIIGAVDVYDKDNNLYKSYKIDKLEGSNLTSLEDTFGKTCSFFSDTLSGNMLSFKAQHLAKHTAIELEVPHGGYITITNNVDESESCMAYNGMDLVVFCIEKAVELVGDSGSSEDLHKELLKLCDDKEFMKRFAHKFGEKLLDELTTDNASENILNISKDSYNLLSEVGIDDFELMKILEKAYVGTTFSTIEKGFVKFAGFAGFALDSIFTAGEYANFVTQVVQIYKHKKANIQRIDATRIISEEENSDKEIQQKPVVKKDISKYSVAGLSNKAYTGKQIKPSVKVLIDSHTQLKKNVDYDVQYSNNVNIGEATVVITGKGKYEGKIIKNFTIVPKTVKSFAQETTNSTKLITMTWTEDSNVTGYEIYRASSKNGKFIKIKDKKGNRFIDSNIKSNKEYYYKIRAYKTVNGKKIYSGFSAVKEMGPKPKKPKLVIQKKKNKLVLMWNKVGVADGYHVYIKKNSEKTWTKLSDMNNSLSSINVKKIADKMYLLSSTSKKNSYAYYGAKLNNSYYFKVRAYRKVGKKMIYSAWSNTKLIKIK